MGYLALSDEPDSIFLSESVAMRALSRFEHETYEFRSNSYRVVGHYYRYYIRLHMACQSMAAPHSRGETYLTVGDGCKQEYSRWQGPKEGLSTRNKIISDAEKKIIQPNASMD